MYFIDWRENINDDLSGACALDDCLLNAILSHDSEKVGGYFC